MATLPNLRDAPGTLREYETIFILAPGIPNDDVATINDRVKGIIESMSGSVIKVDNWGKRRLAYEVEKQLKGIYLYWQYLGTTGLVEELERNLRMLDPVIRFMTVKLHTDIDPQARPSEMSEEAYARAAETAADEEDLMMGKANASTMATATADEAAAVSDEAAAVSDEAAAVSDEAAAVSDEADTADANAGAPDAGANESDSPVDQTTAAPETADRSEEN